MNHNLEFLTLRLEAAKKRLAGSDDYKEIKVLEKIVEEIISAGKRGPYGKKNVRLIKVGRKNFKKDSTNSPGAHISQGSRINYVYNLVEEITKKYGGEIEVDNLVDILKNEYHLVWKDISKNGKDKKGRITTYIRIYNNTHGDDQRLGLWPEATPGAKRVWRYTKIVYTGKESLAANGV